MDGHETDDKSSPLTMIQVDLLYSLAKFVSCQIAYLVR